MDFALQEQRCKCKGKCDTKRCDCRKNGRPCRRKSCGCTLKMCQNLEPREEQSSDEESVKSEEKGRPYIFNLATS